MKKAIISIEYDEKKFEDEEEEQRFLSILQHTADGVCLEFINDSRSEIKTEKL